MAEDRGDVNELLPHGESHGREQVAFREVDFDREP
jgi:hypothetical protein